MGPRSARVHRIAGAVRAGIEQDSGTAARAEQDSGTAARANKTLEPRLAARAARLGGRTFDEEAGLRETVVLKHAIP